jgi:hypothetical protein
MKKINVFIFVILLLTDTQAMAQKTQVLCNEDYYLSQAVSELNTRLASMDDYRVSAPTVSISPGGQHTICVTVTKNA